MNENKQRLNYSGGNLCNRWGDDGDDFVEEKMGVEQWKFVVVVVVVVVALSNCN